MYNKKVLSTALKNLNKTNSPVKKKDSLYPMDNNYQFNDNMPMMKEGGSKNFVNSKDHGVNTPVYIKTEEKSSPIHGTGVFTKQPVTKGQIIGVSHIRKEFERDGQIYQAPFPSKTIGGYNHSESPNVTEVDNGDHIVMIALKDIQPGEELVSNYYESNIDDLEKPEDFKNELVKANRGLPVAKGIASELGLINKTAPFINEWGNLIKKGSSLAIPELNQVIRNLSQVSPQIGVEFPSVYFHGTNSSILPGLLKNAGLTNQGDLSKLGITSFAGENMFGSQGINQQALSTVSADNIDEALKYSLFNLQGNPSDDFAKWWGEQRLGYTKDYSPKSMLPAPEFYDQLYNSRLDAYNNLSNEEKILTENKFPLLFGIHPKYGDNSRFVIPRSDISGETGIRGNINFDEISNIFVPSSKVGQVQSFLKPHYNFNISEIEPFLENTNWRNKYLLDRYKEYGFKTGGSTKGLKRNKRGSKSLLATNKLFAPNKLFKKPRKGKIYNPNADSFRYGGYVEAQLSQEEIDKYVKDGYIVEELPKADRGIVSLGKNASKILTPIVEEATSLRKYFPNQFMATSNLGKFIGSTGNIDLGQLKAAIGKESMGLTHKWPILEKQLIKEFGDMPTSLPLSEIQRVTNDAIVPYTMNLNPRGNYNYGVFDEGMGRLDLGFTKGREALTWTDKERNQYNAAQSYLQHFDLLKDAMEIGNISVPTYKSKVDETLSNIGRRPGSLFYGSGVSTIEDLQSIINKWDNPEIYEPLSQQTNVLSGLGEGSQRHNNPKGTLAAAHSYIDPDTPDTRNYTQFQSDALQGTHHIWKDKEKKLKKIQEDFQSLQKDVDLLNQAPEGEKKLLEESLNKSVFEKYGLNTYQEAIDIFPRQIANAENEIIAVKGSNPKQKELLEKNWESVLLQQLMSEAAAEGMTKIRVPTGETSIKIQNYKKTPQWTGEEENIFGSDWETITSSSLTEPKPRVYDYTNEQKTVIRRYNKLPKTLKKSFGFTDDQIKTVTDRNGNTWYEVEIPESFLQGQGQIIHKDGGSVKLPKAKYGIELLKGMTNSVKPIVNTFNTFKGLTNMAPKLADLSRVNYINSVYPGTLELISDLKNSNIISPTLNETTLAMNPNLLNLVTKRGIQDALTFTRSTTPSVLEGLSSSGTRTPISNLDMGNFIKYGLVGDDPGLAMYTASHVPGMRYGRRDGLSRLPYETTLVGNAKQGTPESLDALYTFPQITGIPQNVQEGIFGDDYGSYASILRYPFDYSGSASDMFDRYKTFENTVFDKGRTLREYRGSKDAAAGDIGALNFVNKPTSDNIFYQSIFSHASEVPFIGHPGQKVLEPVATYTKPIVQEIKDERNRITNLYNEGKYEEMINELNKKVKTGDFGSVESNIKSMDIDDPQFATFDLSKYNLPKGGDRKAYLLDAFDPKTGLIKTKGDLKSIANKAIQSYWGFSEKGLLMDAFRDPTNVVKYNYSPLKYKFKKGGKLPKANGGLQVAKTLGLKSSANILDDLLVRTRGLWQTPEGISRLNQMITNTPAMSSLNVTPEIMVNDLSNLTNLNYIADDALKQQKILNEQKLNLRKILREANNAGISKSDISTIRSAQRKNLSNLLETENKIKDLEWYYQGMGTQYVEPRYSWQTVQSNPYNHSITIGKDKFTAGDIPMIGMHEITHFPGTYYGRLSPGSTTFHTYLDDMLSGLDLKSDSELTKQMVDYGTPLKYNMGNLLTGSERIKLKDKFGNVIPNQFEHPLLSAKIYFKNNLQEKSPFLSEVREKMLQDGFIKHPYETMTPTKLKTYYNNYNNITDNKYPLRYFEIMKPTESNFKLTSDVFNKMLIGLPAVGAAALGSDLDEKAVGGPMLGDPPVVEDPMPITPDSELDKAQKFIRDWYNNRTLAPIDDPRYTKIMTQSLEDAKERVKSFPQYTPLITDDPTARGTYVGGKNPEIQIVPNLDPEEDTLTKVHELTTYVNEPLTENQEYQDIYGNIIKQNVKSFKEGWGNLTGADKKAARQFYDYVTDPSEDNIHSYMMNARRIFDVSPDQIVTEADIENWKKTAEDEGMLDRNSENYNDELYILFKLAKDNKSMTNMFNYLAMDESPQMEGDIQMAKMGGVISLGDEVDEATMKKLKAQGYTFEEI